MRTIAVAAPATGNDSNPRGAMRRHKDPGTAGRPDKGATGRRPWSGRRSVATLVFGSLAVVLALALVGGVLTAYAKYRSVMGGINRVDVTGDLHGKRPPTDPNAMNILVIGSDTRLGKNGQIGGRAGIQGARSDTIMLVHIAPGAHQIVVMSIPRDSVVPILSCTPESGTTGQTAQPAYAVEQINATFAYGGPGCLWKTIEQTTGIHINDFVMLTFLGFEKVIDALHGVEICLPGAVNDPKSNLYLSAGRHHVYGREALAFWRTREGVGTGSDPQRIQRDQFLMASLLQGIEHSALLKSPSTMLRVIDTLTSHDYVTTDSGLTPEVMLHLGEDLRGLSTESVQFLTVPWTTYAGNAQWISSSQTPATGNVNWVQWIQPQANHLFSAIAHDTRLPRTRQAGTRQPRPAQVSVRVMNGTTRSGLAASTASALTGRGFHVLGPATDAAVSDYGSSVIEYGNPSAQAAAQTLAALIPNVHVQHDTHLHGKVVRLILGASFTGLNSASGNSSITHLAKTYGGITGGTNICSDKAAFAGPLGY